MRSRRAIVAVTAALVAGAVAAPCTLAASASAAGPSRTITILPKIYAPNCFPFGTGGFVLEEWKPYMAFVYKDIPSFQLRPGDTIAFDNAAVNDADAQLQIDMAAATGNGADVQAQPFTKVVSNTQTPTNPRGDTTVGNFEMRFADEAPFSFPGGGLLIRFSHPSVGFLADATCTQTVVTGSAGDQSGFFVERAVKDADGVAPWDSKGTNFIGAFRLELSSPFALGNPRLNKRRGTARLPVTVPAAGTLSLAGKGVATQSSPRAGAAMKVADAGTVDLLVKPKGGTRGKLNRSGHVKVKVNVTFAAVFGKPVTAQARIKLKKR